MKNATKAIAMQVKKRRQDERKTDTGVYGKKLHANQSDVLKVQDVGKNQTFNQIMQKGKSGADGENFGRKNQIKKRQQLLAQEKAKRKKKKQIEETIDKTARTYTELKEHMGDRYYMGYSTSSDESEQEDKPSKEESREDKPKDENQKEEETVNISKEIRQEFKKQKEFDDSIQRKDYIISTRSKYKFYWDLIIIVFAVINAITLPLEMAFEEEINKLSFIGGLTWMTTVIFLIDIIVGFLTSFINVSSGDEIFSIKMIASNYLIQGTFFSDFISTIQIDLIYKSLVSEVSDSTYSAFKLIGMIKILRLQRLKKIIGNLNQTQETKAFLKVMNMVFILIIYIHVIACLLWKVLLIDQQWIPAVDFIYVETRIFQESTPFEKKYFSMCYHAIMVFGLNEVAPRSEIETFFVILMMILSAIANAYIFGEMAVLVQEMDKKDIEFQESLDNANTAMHSLDIPEKIQDDIREYLMSVNEYKTQQNEMKDFMDSISPSLKADVCKFIFFVAVNQNQLLSKMLRNPDYIKIISNIKYRKEKQVKSNRIGQQINLYSRVIKQKNLNQDCINFLDDIVKRMQIRFEEPEARIIIQNQDRSEGNSNYMFFIERGECLVQINDKDKMRNKKKNVRTLYPGDYFGEIAFLYDSKRQASVTSSNYTTLGQIPENQVMELFGKYPFYKEELIKRTIRYDDDLKIFLESALKTIMYLDKVPDETINKIIFSMSFAKFDKGSKIFQVDETSGMMQIIQNGMVEIYTTMDNGVEFVIERLYRGSVINHRSFITEDKIDVNARCQMPVTLFYITWDKMKEIKEESPVLSRKIDAIEVMLINKDNPIALDYIISRDATVMKNNNQTRSRKEQAYRDNLTVKLKNAIMFYIVKTRILKRIPNFNEILNMAINKKKREMHAARRKQQEFDLDQLGPEDTYLTDEQFSLIKEQIEKIKLTLDDQETKISTLKMKLTNLTKKNPNYQQYS